VYLHSIKLYDPKTPATNEHFITARHTKAAFEQKIQEGVKDLLEKHAQKDLDGKTSARNVSELFQKVPT
jgi:hypothetical protein